MINEGKSHLSFNPEKLSPQANYHLLTGAVIPRPVALITTLTPQGTVNLAPFSFFNIVSSDPPILAVAIQRQEGRLKDTACNLLSEKAAVVHIVDERIVSQANQTAAQLPRGVSELTVAAFTTIPSSTTKVPGLKESQVRFETTYNQHIPLPSAAEATADLFLLNVTQYHVAKAVYVDGRIDQQVLKGVSRLGGSDYGTIGRTFSLKRPQ